MFVLVKANPHAKQFGAWFTRRFLKWQSDANEDRSLTDFARWLDISLSDASRYKRGLVVPNSQNLRKIADKLEWEAYDEAGVPRPTGDERLEKLMRNWDVLTEDVRESIFNLFQRGKAISVLREGKGGKKDGQKKSGNS